MGRYWKDTPLWKKGEIEFSCMFNPQQPFEFDDTTPGNIRCGGWSVWVFSLEGLYMEHQLWKNRWSSSNCGFDLVLYFGTRLTFIPHLHRDYLIFVETDYRSSEHFFKQYLHPAVILTHPNSRIIWSYKRKRYYKLPHIWVPRPSMWYDGWQDMRQVCRQGMFYLYVCFIDFDNPFMAPNYQGPGKDGSQKYEWWKPHLPGQTAFIPNKPHHEHVTQGDWLSSWGQGPSATQSEVQVKPDGGQNTYDPGLIASNHGPFVPKYGTLGYDQVCMFYKSYWMWGGNQLRVKKICDPCQEPPFPYDPPARPGG